MMWYLCQTINIFAIGCCLVHHTLYNISPSSTPYTFWWWGCKGLTYLQFSNRFQSLLHCGAGAQPCWLFGWLFLDVKFVFPPPVFKLPASHASVCFTFSWHSLGIQHSPTYISLGRGRNQDHYCSYRQVFGLVVVCLHWGFSDCALPLLVSYLACNCNWIYCVSCEEFLWRITGGKALSRSWRKSLPILLFTFLE